MNQKELFILSLTIFFTIVAWLLLDIYKVTFNSSIQQKIQKIPSINFKIDAEVLRSLKLKDQ